MSFESAMAQATGNTPNTPAAPATAAPGTTGDAKEALSAALDGGQAPPAPIDGATPPAAAEPRETASQSFQALAKERKQVLELRRQLKERETSEADMKRRLAEIEGKSPAPKPTDPIAALQAAGFSYADASEFVLNNSSLTPEQQLKAVREEIAADRAEREKEKKSAQEEAQKRARDQETQAVTDFKGQIAEFLTGKADEFELLSQEDPGEVQDLIYNLIAQAYSNGLEEQKRTGKPPRILSVDEGAKLAEGYFEQRLEKFMTTKKMQGRYGSRAAEPAQATSTQAGSKTLSQAPAAGSAGTRPPARTEDERIKRATEALERAQNTRR